MVPMRNVNSFLHVFILSDRESFTKLEDRISYDSPNLAYDATATPTRRS